MFFRTKEDLINSLKEKGVLKTERIIKAFLRIDRKDFVPSDLLDDAYNDYPLPIGKGQTISQPYTVAFMLELLEPKEGQKILDIGFGSGWTTCLLAEIVGAQGKVYGVEIVPEIFEFGKNNIKKYNFLAKNIINNHKGRIEIFLKDGSKGLSEKAPFDRILVSAEAKKILEELILQLNDHGILVMPADGGIYKITKIGDKIDKEFYFGFVFVPLING